MRHRQGITLLEVLVAIFIMGIGLLSLLVLFPLAALTMAHAIRDDRSAQCAQQANGWALALGLRTDTNVQPPPPAPGAPAPPISLPCFIDGIGLSNGLSTTFVTGPTPAIQRLYPANAGWGGSATTVNALTHFCLLDDLTFFNDGTATDPVAGGNFIQRAGQYTWAYFLTSAGTNSLTSAPLIDLQVVVYFGRTSQSAETTLTPSGTNAVGSTSLLISYAGTPPALRRGSWILDGGPTGGAPTGVFYRVDDVTDLGGTMELQLEQPLKSNITSSNVVLYLEDVIEVFDQGAQ